MSISLVQLFKVLPVCCQRLYPAKKDARRLNADLTITCLFVGLYFLFYYILPKNKRGYLKKVTKTNSLFV